MTIKKRRKLNANGNEPRKGGYRKNAGRKKGSVTKTTLEQREAMDRMKKRIIRATDMLLNSQMGLAKGSYSLWCQKYDNHGKKKGKAFLVQDDTIIECFLNGEMENSRDTFYYMRKDKADNKAIANLFDRAYGKPKETLDASIDIPEDTKNKLDLFNNNLAKSIVETYVKYKGVK